MANMLVHRAREIGLQKNYVVKDNAHIYTSKGNFVYGFPPSSIWLAEKDGDKYILKIVMSKKEYKREIRSLRKVHTHPNIVPLVETYSYDCYNVLVEPFVGTRNLPRCLDSGITLSNFIRYMISATRGVGHSHDMNITHHNLHQDNIRIGEKEGSTIIDFQLANKTGQFYFVQTRRYGRKGEKIVFHGPIEYYPSSKVPFFSSKDVDLHCLVRIIDSTLGYTLSNRDRTWFTDIFNDGEQAMKELGLSLLHFIKYSTSDNKRERPKNANQLITRLEDLLGNPSFEQFSEWVSEQHD